MGTQNERVVAPIHFHFFSTTFFLSPYFNEGISDYRRATRLHERIREKQRRGFHQRAVFRPLWPLLRQIRRPFSLGFQGDSKTKMGFFTRILLPLIAGLAAGVYADKTYKLPNVEEKMKEGMALYESFTKKK